MINIIIVDDDDTIREGLKYLVNSSEGFKCVGDFGSAEDALAEMNHHNPDVILMDINLPGLSGIECMVVLKEHRPDLQIIMLTIHEDDDAIFKSLVAGASGYLLKKTQPAKLLEAIEDVARGGSPMSSQIARRVVQTFQQKSEPAAATEILSKREDEILIYLSKGYRYKEISDELFISVETVRTHIRNIYEKLQVRSRTEAVIKYLNK
jgi:DNA-binding NarL/FixJ family response regulator